MEQKKNGYYAVYAATIYDDNASPMNIGVFWTREQAVRAIKAAEPGLGDNIETIEVVVFDGRAYRKDHKIEVKENIIDAIIDRIKDKLSDQEIAILKDAINR